MTLLALVSSAWAGAGSVLINEVLYDPDTKGGDDGNEWIELCNASGSTIDVSGWTIESAGTSWSDSWDLKAGSIPAGGYLIIGAGSSTHPGSFAPNLQNGGSSSDGIRLLDDGGGVIDTLLYDTPNDNGLEDDSGSAGTSFAPDVSAGHALARAVDCTDTDDSGADFVETSVLTPGKANTGGGGGDCDGTVLINEILPNPAGSDTDNEWLELYNPGGSTVDLDGWRIEWGTSSFSSGEDLAGSIPAGGYFVVGGAKVAGTDLIASISMGNASSSGDGVQLLDCDGFVADTLIYGPNNDDGFLDDTGAVASSLAEAPGDGQSLGRSPDGFDTDQSGDDFVLLDPPTPGSANTAGGGDCDGADDIKLNELLPDAEGTDEGYEFVELYNAGSSTIALDGWTLEWGTSSYSKTYSLPVGIDLGPGDYLVIGGKLVPEADLVADLDLGNASSSGDATRLRHCGGGIADTVVYGPDNSDGFVDDTGAKALSVAPTPASGSSLARVSDGHDTDESGVDFALSDEPTPGAGNPEVVPPTCVPGAGTIKVNEFLSDPDGTDGGFEWVELYNAGDEDQRLDAWELQIGKSDWSVVHLFAGGTSLEAGDFLLIGAEGVEGADIVVEGLSLGNASTAPDGIRILDCEGAVEDTVLYGDPEEPEDLLLDDSGDQTMVEPPATDRSAGRAIDGLDTEDNAEDFETDLDPTPGAPNASGGAGGGSSVGKGCGKKDGANKKCATGPDGGVLAALMAFVAIRRRRRLE